MLERIFYELSENKNDRSCYEITKIGPKINNFGRRGREVRGPEIKVKSESTEGSYGFGEFRRLFGGMLVEKDMMRILGLAPGRKLYASLPRLYSR